MQAIDSDQKSWRQALQSYTDPRICNLFILGISAGLPYLLVFSTLSAWLRDEGINRATIGFLSWIGITYSIKVFWAPIIDRIRLPLLGKTLGRRRSWILLAQLGVVCGLLGMSKFHPAGHLSQFVWFALLIAFASATQDICIDAYRIESVPNNKQAAATSVYIFGYRIAVLISGAGALYIADFSSWNNAYLTMAAIMLLCMLSLVTWISEPPYTEAKNVYLSEQRVISYLDRSLHLPDYIRNISAWFIGSVICPFTDFFARHGYKAIIIIALIGIYRISDITMAIMANPFYLDLGFSKSQIASVSKIFGFAMTMLGTFLGGILAARFGVMRSLLLGAVLIAASNLLYAWLNLMGPDIRLLAVTISADNISAGLSSVVFIAYMSGLTSKQYTATQYALFSSFMTLPGKLLGGFSGVVVNHSGYTNFFIYTALLGIPTIMVIMYLMGQGHGQIIESPEQTQ